MLKRKETVAKFRILHGHDYLTHHLKKMNIIDLDICVLCNQNSIMNSKHLSIQVYLTEKRQQAKDISNLY